MLQYLTISAGARGGIDCNWWLKCGVLVGENKNKKQCFRLSRYCQALRAWDIWLDKYESQQAFWIAILLQLWQSMRQEESIMVFFPDYMNDQIKMSGSHTGLCPVRSLARQARSPSPPLSILCELSLASFSHCTKWSNNLPSDPSLNSHQALYHYDTREFLSG